MPQSSYAYAVARVRAMEVRMLDAAKLNRLREADTQEAFKILQEAGYGAPAQANGDVEPLISEELDQARKVVWDITPAPEVTGLFLLRIDAHNLKALIKARLLGVDASDVVMPGGLFPLEKLEKAVSEKDYRDLPQTFSDALNKVEQLVAREPNPGQLSAAIDKAVFDYAQSVLSQRKNKNAFAKEYFMAQADFLNIMSMIRARALNYDSEKLIPMLLDGGQLSFSDIIECLSLPADQLAKKLARGKNSKAIGMALEEYAQSGSAQALEKRMDAALMSLVRSGKGDTFGLGPIVGYLLGREAEARALRIIFAAKRMGSEAVLPELYA